MMSANMQRRAASHPRRHVNPHVDRPITDAPRTRGKTRWLAGLLLVGGVAIALAMLAQRGRARRSAPILHYRVVHRYPHDPGAYCQGLVYDRGTLYEGTGNYGHSSLRIVDLESGRVRRQHDLDRRLFGEGITVWKEYLIQLTWKNRQAIVYDRTTFQEIKRFTYHGEGWGLTQNGKHLIMSDGSSILRFLDPDTFAIVRRVTVREGSHRVRYLNELEYIDGVIYANVWQTDRIAKIDPKSGRVLAWLDLTGLYPPSQRPDSDCVLNGIAFDAPNRRLLVTGKHWPSLFEIKEVRGTR